jgi:hypothetical protein
MLDVKSEVFEQVKKGERSERLAMIMFSPVESSV